MDNRGGRNDVVKPDAAKKKGIDGYRTVGSLENLMDADISEIAVERVVLEITVAAEQLQCVVANLKIAPVVVGESSWRVMGGGGASTLKPSSVAKRFAIAQ